METVKSAVGFMGSNGGPEIARSWCLLFRPVSDPTSLNQQGWDRAATSGLATLCKSANQ